VAAKRELSGMETSGDPNLPVYNSRTVAEHYASLKYLTRCEQMLLETYVKPGMAVLDLGVGGGRTTAYLSSRASRYVGLDFAEEMISLCKNRFKDLEFVVGDAGDLSRFEDGSFDAVIFAFNGIDYVVPDQNRERCLQECNRVLKNGGVLIFSSHNPRAILVRPAWDQARVSEFAEHLVGQSVWLGSVIAAATMAKAAITIARAAASSAIRIVRRLPHATFWKGHGWLTEDSHGGLTLHCATPRNVIAEAARHGFRLFQAQGDDYPRISWIYSTDWYYYVFAKSVGTESSETCA
jgi:ubiquinone/menaquinone biosynthesis C-methylase UbiE